MKAIILVDIPDYYNLDDIRAYCSLHTQHGEILLKNGNYFDVRPLPQKLKLRIQREWITDYDRYEIGYNACLEKIENG